MHKKCEWESASEQDRAAVKSKQNAANHVENVNKRCAPKSPAIFEWRALLFAILLYLSVRNTKWARARELERQSARSIEHSSTQLLLHAIKMLLDRALAMRVYVCAREFPCEGVCVRVLRCLYLHMCACSRALLAVAFVALFWQSFLLMPSHSSGQGSLWTELATMVPSETYYLILFLLFILSIFIIN